METAPPNLALVCVPSSKVTNPQNLSPIPAEMSLIILNTLPYSDTSTDKITATGGFKKDIPIESRPTKYLILKKKISSQKMY
jgi:hypothetical protein